MYNFNAIAYSLQGAYGICGKIELVENWTLRFLTPFEILGDNRQSTQYTPYRLPRINSRNEAYFEINKAQDLCLFAQHNL